VFDKNIRTWTVDRSVTEAAEAERLQRAHEEQVALVRARQAAFDAAQQASADHRRQVERDVSDAKRDAGWRQAESAQLAQRAFAIRRNELRDRVVELQRALQGAEARVLSTDLDDAVRAAGEVPVYLARIDEAELAYAQHAGGEHRGQCWPSRSPL
jgi:hypothetical protein